MPPVRLQAAPPLRYGRSKDPRSDDGCKGRLHGRAAAGLDEGARGAFGENAGPLQVAVRLRAAADARHGLL